jgi:hypothetical protein
VFTYTLGFEYYDYIDMIGHNYNGFEFSTDTTKVYEWSDLLAIFDANEDGEITEAEGLKMFGNSPTSCSETGFGSFDCADCGTSYLISMTGDHEWVKGETFAPTCDADGYTVYTCSKDATHTKNADTVAMIGHAMVYDYTDEANKTIYFKCSNECGKVTSVVAESWEIKRQEPTCCADGWEYIEYTFTENGATVTKKTAPVTLPMTTNIHTYADGIVYNWNLEYYYSELLAKHGVEVDGEKVLDPAKWTVFGNAGATCVDKGYVSFKCTVCGEDALITIKGDCNNEHIIEKATCTEAGRQYDKCTVCGTITNEAVILASGHKLSKIETVIAASATQDGKYVVKCNCVSDELHDACGLVEEIVVPAWNAETWKADGWHDNQGTKEATCQKDGHIGYGYKVVSEIPGVDAIWIAYYDIIPAGEHKAEVPPAEQTWTYNGYVYTGYYCGTCKMMIVTNKVAA